MRKVKAFFAKVLGPGKFQMTRISLFAIFISFLVGVILLLSLGKNPFSAYLNLLQGAGFFAKKSYAGHQGQFSDFMSFLDYLTPMIFAALGVAVGNKAGLFNIGISGQMIVAGFVASITVGIGCTLPSYVAKPLVIIIGAICGAGMGALIGWLKYKFNINEVVSSIMLNYIARYIIAFFINTFYVDPITRQSKKIADAARLTLQAVNVGDLRVNIPLGFLLAILTAFVVKFYIDRTTSGFEIKAVGLSRNAARYAGINVGTNIVLSMLLSGLLSGLAGVTYFLGQYASIQPNMLPALGFNSIAVSLLGDNNPIGIIFASALVTIISKGSTYMSSRQGVELEITSLITGLILLFASCSVVIKITADRASQRIALGGEK